MRYWMMLLGMLLLVCCLAGCEEEEEQPSTTRSLLTFRYDAARDVVLANTAPITTTLPVTGTAYAGALTRQPDVSYAPSPTIQLSDPAVTLSDGGLTVNYRTATDLGGLASAQSTAVLAALEAWWWTPGVRTLRVQAAGQPLTTVGPVAVTQPLSRTFHTYVVQPLTGEVAYLVGALNPATLADAVAVIQRREITEFPATQGFQPLLPPGVTMTVATDRLADGVLPVNLSAEFPRAQSFRLAGIVLMLTQYPEVDAVRFTFGGETIDAPFMRGNLNAPITPQLLLLPADAARPASREITQTLQAAVQARLGKALASYGPALVWREWATISVVPEAGAAAQTFVLKQAPDGFTVQLAGANLTAEQLTTANVPRDAIIALRIPGWETLAAGQQ